MRRETKCEALRALLSNGYWHHHMELVRVGGTRFGGRLHELRQRGYDHEWKRDAAGNFMYRAKEAQR